ALIIISNTLAIYVFTRSKLLRKRTNYFLLCLAIADMLVGAISLPMFIHTLLVYARGETLGSMINLVPRLLDIFTGFASVFALTIISLERLYSVALPNWHRTTPSYVYCILISIIWTLAGVFVFIKIVDDKKWVSADAHLFFYCVIVSFFICLVVICLAYVGIWIKVIQRMHEKTKRTMEKDKRLAFTLFLVTAIFIVTWLPFQVINILVPVWCAKTCDRKIVVAVNLTKLLQYINSFVNPIIYTFKMPDFRRVLLALIGRRSYGASTRATSRMITERRNKRASTLRSSESEANGNCEHAL
ncbi:hypothetical protein OS493_038183, partial [Desmophyllum pertusum]